MKELASLGSAHPEQWIQRSPCLQQSSGVWDCLAVAATHLHDSDYFIASSPLLADLQYTRQYEHNIFDVGTDSLLLAYAGSQQSEANRVKKDSPACTAPLVATLEVSIVM